MVNFDKLTHTYTDDEGTKVPSVSQIIDALGLTEGISEIPNIEFYAQRGTMAHYALELYANGIAPDTDGTFEMMIETELEENPLVKWEQVLPYFMSGKKFLDEFTTKKKVNILHTERKFIVEGYAGTVDLIVDLGNNTVAVFDWKTGKSVQKTYHVQISAYALAVCANSGSVLKLKGDGTIAERVDVDINEGTSKWLKLLELYQSNLPEKQKKEMAKALFDDRKVITDDKSGNKLIEKKILIDVKKEELKELETSFAEIRESLKLTESSVFSDDTYELKLTLVPGKTEQKINHEKLCSNLMTRLGELKQGEWVSKQIEACTEEKKTNPSWRTYLVERTDKSVNDGADTRTPPDAEPAPKNTKTKGTPPDASDSSLDIDKPVIDRSEIKYETDPDCMKSGKPAATKSPVTDKNTRTLAEEKVEAVLKERGMEKYTEIFWVTVENEFGISIREGVKAGEIDMNDITELAKIIEESVLKTNKKKFREGQLL